MRTPSLLLLLPLALSAQTPTQVCEGIRVLNVGIWAEYELVGMEAGVLPTRMWNAIVGTERRGDTTFWWHESDIEADEGSLIIQSLVPSYPFNARQVRGIVMKMGEEPPTRMPDYMLEMMRQQDAPSEMAYLSAEECAQSEDLGWEEVATPAGTVRAWHARAALEDGDHVDVWMSPAVPFGIVRLIGAGVTLTLQGYGRDARSRITETPQEIP